MSRCAECGFDWDIGATEVVAEVGRFGQAYRAGLTRFLDGEDGEALVRRRPSPGVWSALEYAAHMRDVAAFYLDRIERVLAEDRPVMAAVGFARLAEERRYAEEHVEPVLDALGRATHKAAARLAGLTTEEWSRVGIGSEGGERTVLVLARRLAHDGHHHLLDIGRGLRHIREQDRAGAPGPR